MTDRTATEQPEADPQTAQLVKRVRRMMLISGATTLAALGIVFAVIGYRVFHGEGSAAPDAAPSTIVLPAGARVLNAGVSDGRIAVTIAINGAVEIRTFDLKTLRPAGQIVFSTAPAQQ
jgi:hypothetical protein